MASRSEFSSTRLTRGVKDRWPETSVSSSMATTWRMACTTRVVLDVQAVEGLGGQAVLFLYEAEQDVLGAHVGLMKRAGLVLRQDEHLARLVRELSQMTC